MMNLVGIGECGFLGTRSSGKRELVHTEGAGSQVDEESSHKHGRKSKSMAVRVGTFCVITDANKHLERYFHDGRPTCCSF